MVIHLLNTSFRFNGNEKFSKFCKQKLKCEEILQKLMKSLKIA